MENHSTSPENDWYYLHEEDRVETMKNCIEAALRKLVIASR